MVIDQDYQARLGWQKPPREISQIQAVTCHWPESTSTWVFATLKETEGLWNLYFYEDAFDAIGIFGYTIFGCVSGFILAVLVCTISIIFLVIYMRRKQPEKG